MTTYKVRVHVRYLDAAERVSERVYVLRQRFDSTANAGAGNMDDVLSAKDDLITALSALTWDDIPECEVCLVSAETVSPANVAANNQVEAFTRVVNALGEPEYFAVPAWDDFTYDQDSNNLLSAAYNTAAQDVADLIEGDESGSTFDTVMFTQSRARKSRGKKIS